MKKYSDEYLLNHLKELSAQLGRTPSIKDINDAGKVEATIYYDRFGSLSKAQLAAGLIPNKAGHRQKYSDEYLLEYLRELSEKLGRTPSASDINEAGNVSSRPYWIHFGTLNKAQEAAGLVPNKMGMEQKYSDEYLLNHLRELSEKLGRTPGAHDLSEAGKESIRPYCLRFGSLDSAIKSAGLAPYINRVRPKEYSEEYLLNHLIELAEKLGRTPYGSDIDEAGKASSSIYNKFFGSLSKAQKAAGLVPNKTGNPLKYSDEYLLNILRELSKRFGRIPGAREIAEAGKTSTSPYIKRFGSLNKALRAAGLFPPVRISRQKYSNEYLLNHLRELSEQLGRTPYTRDIDEDRDGSTHLYQVRFGSFYNAIKAAGLIPTKTGGPPKYSDEYLLNRLRELSKQLGRTPYARDIDEAGKECSATYQVRFGTFSKAIKASGLVPNKKGSVQKYSNEYLLNHLKELSEQLGRTPSAHDINKAGKGRSTLYKVRFGSFGNAIKAAGLILNK
jgi:transcriptional regulator NrdR family protein